MWRRCLPRQPDYLSVIEVGSICLFGLSLLWQLPPIILAIAVLVALFAVLREHRGALGRRESDARDPR